MSSQDSLGNFEIITIEGSDSSTSSNDFTLKFTSESESDHCETEELKLQVSSSDERGTSGYSSSVEIPSTMIQKPVNDIVRPRISSIFDFRMFIKMKTVSSQTLDDDINKVEAYLKSTRISNKSDNEIEESHSSSESELELNQFRKINNKTNRDLFSPDSSIHSEASFMQNRILEKSDCVAGQLTERRITRSQTIKLKKMTQQQVLNVFKVQRSKAIKSLIPLVFPSARYSSPATTMLRQKLREMKIFTFI